MLKYITHYLFELQQHLKQDSITWHFQVVVLAFLTKQ